jgi:hypothetical protein
MNRRDFLKCLAGLTATVVGAKLLQPAVAAATQSASIPDPYGAGAYGQATYSSYGVYLPFVSRGGK